MMWTPRACRPARQTKAALRRYLPRLDFCEDRLAPGQVFALFTDPLNAPFGALTDPSENGPVESAVTRSSASPDTLRPNQADAGFNPGQPASRERLVVTPATPAPAAGAVPTAAPAVDTLTQAVAAWASATIGQDLLNQNTQVQVEGTVEALCALMEDGSVRTDFYLNTGGQRLQLSGLPEHLDDGAVVSVAGTQQGDTLTVDPNAINILEPSAFLPPGEGGPGVTAVRTILVINMNFQNLQTQPWTQQALSNLWNGQFSDWFNEGSYGQVQLSVDVTPWVTIASNSSPCNSSTWATQAQTAARGLGYEPNNYNHVAFAFPRASSCQWSGLGQAPGRLTWHNGAGMSRNVVAHELGHNLGLLHAQSRTCTDGPLDGTCTVSEYGDRYDTMGNGSAGAHFHQSYRNAIGWIPSSDRIVVTELDGVAVVPIASGAASEGPRIVQVVRRGQSTSLFVETREAVGFDAPLINYPTLINGVAVYLGSNTNLRSQAIVDFGYTTTSAIDAGMPLENVLIDFVGDVLILPLFRDSGYTWILVYYGLS